MALKKRRSNLLVETLEARWCPALTVRNLSSGLEITGTISGIGGRTNLRVSGAGGNALRVLEQTAAEEGGAGAATETGFSLGTYAVTGNLTINLRHHVGGVINVDLNGQTLPGSLTIDMGLGNTVNNVLTNHVAVLDGTIGGNAFFRNGSGTEFVQMGFRSGAESAAIVVNGDTIWTARVSPSTPAAAGGFGDVFDSASISAAANRFSRGITLQNVNTTFIGGGTTVNGDLNVIALNDQLVQLGTFAGVVVGGLVNGNVNVVGSNFRDIVEIGGGPTLGTNGRVLGAVNVNLGAGDNQITFGGAATAVVGGSVTYSGLGGNDTVAINAGTTLQSSSTFNTGDGNNVYTLGTAWTAFGSFTINGGNGNDGSTAAGAAITFVGSSIFGNVSLNMGHGINGANFNGTINGATVRYVGGSGVDTVTQTSTSAYALDVNLGAGGDTFAYGAATATVGSAVIDGGIDVDTDTYTQDGVVAVTWPETLKNFP